MNTAEAARSLRVSEASIRRWNDAGLLRGRRVGGRHERRFTEEDLTAFLGAREPAISPPASPKTISVGGTQLAVPGHLATYYSSDAGAVRLSVPFLAEGLRSGQTCYLVATGKALERYKASPNQQEGIDFNAGQLQVITFDGRSAIPHWEQAFGRALATGPTVVRLVGEMASVRSMFSSEDEMLRFEEGFDVMCRRYPVVALCQYDVREFAGSAILRSLKAHPDLFDFRLGTVLN